MPPFRPTVCGPPCCGWHETAGLLSVLAVYFLQLRHVAREDPERPARALFGDHVTEVMGR